jgi:hypothetical protein
MVQGNRQVPRPAHAGLAGSLPTGRQEGAQLKQYFFARYPFATMCPGKPRRACPVLTG